MKEFFFLYVFFCSNQSYEKGTPFSNVLRNKFKELFILTQTILQSLDNRRYTKFIEKYSQANILFKECKTYQKRKEHFDELYLVTKELKACIRRIKTKIKRNIITIKTQGRINS